MNSCKQCHSEFEVTEADRSFYAKLEVPEPTLCSACRQQRRLAFRNERTLYKRKCSGTGGNIVSIYPPDTSFPVYDHSYFFSDQWSALDHGRDFDFNRPFFEQFHELAQIVPRMKNYSVGNENAEYGNYSSWNKNCYLLFEADNNHDCLYAEYSYRCKNIVDCSYTSQSERCYECTDVVNSQNLRYCLNTRNCSDSWFLQNCSGCRNCFGCVNLKNKSYCFFNEQLTENEFNSRLQSLDLSSHSEIKNHWKKFLEFAKKFPCKYLHGFNNEDSTGDYLYECKNAESCFDSTKLRDCTYVFHCENIKDGYDLDTYGGVEGAERVYECQSVGRGAFNVAFSNNVYQNLTDVWYSESCANGKDLFGCVSLQHGQYCILNKQYSKEEYFELRSRIVQHMKSTGEWGEFFPASISPFGYNETVAQERYPMTREEVLARGWKWCDLENKVSAEKIIPANRLPEKIEDIPDDVLNWAITCAETEKPFKITPQELQYYRQHQLSIPHFHPDIRYQNRMKLRNPRLLFDRMCPQCEKPLRSTYAKERPEKVLCEECYLKI